MNLKDLVKDIEAKRFAFCTQYNVFPNTILFPKNQVCKLEIAVQPWLTATTLTNQNMLSGMKILIVDDPFLSFMKVALL